VIKNDVQYGKPFVQYTGTQSAIEALTGLAAGSVAYATDIKQLGSYDGTTWTWGAVASVPTPVYNEEVKATGATTYYLANYAIPGSLRVYINGILQPVTDDTVPSDIVTFATPPALGALITFAYDVEIV
jgi:hypothetical protein